MGENVGIRRVVEHRGRASVIGEVKNAGRMRRERGADRRPLRARGRETPTDGAGRANMPRVRYRRRCPLDAIDAVNHVHVSDVDPYGSEETR
jgi:hypothetical protein